MYSDGRNFAYTYDASGNVLELEQNLGPGTIITAYAYDEANQLNIAQQGSTIWQYTYDANGSLISDGMKTYTYDSANRLLQVSDQLSVTSLSYNGLGQRLSMDAAGVIATYVLDGNQPLTAESNGNTTFYLYGLGAIGEETNAWSYSLPDGTNTPRQLTNSLAEITLASRYTPWGDTLDTYGIGNFTFGYLGGVLDATTGLIYVSNGQYYDPSTGRFLMRDVNPDSTNPYVPWNPIGAILGPLGLIALVFGRRKKGSKTGTFLVLLLVVGSAGMTLVACGGGSEQSAPAPTLPPPNVVVIGSDGTTTVNGTPVAATPGAPLTPLAVPCPTPTATPSGFKTVRLTFDDGPSWGSLQQNSNTNSILDTLYREGVKATFFVVGQGAIYYPATVARMVSDGHTIGSHSFNHPDFVSLDNATIKDEIVRTEDAIASAVDGSLPPNFHYFRYPYLSSNSYTDEVIHSIRPNYEFVPVDIDSKDFEFQEQNKTAVDLADFVVPQILASTNPKPIVLFHSIHNVTADAMPLIIARLKAAPYGYQFEALP